MPGVEVRGQAELRALSARLRAAGKEGQGLRRKLYKKNREAARPLAEEIARVEHLKPYMPDRYAVTLAEDLGVRTANYFSANPRIEIRAKARAHRRKLRFLDTGFINHPVFARGPRRGWEWSNGQTGGMKSGFFSDAAKNAAPQIREKILEAMAETARQITGG